MNDYDFLTKTLFGGIEGMDEPLSTMRAEAKNKINESIIKQFSVFGVILLLSAIAPDAISEIAEKAFADVKNKSAKELGADFMDADEFEALFTEAHTETMATFEKIRALAVGAKKGHK